MFDRIKKHLFGFFSFFLMAGAIFLAPGEALAVPSALGTAADAIVATMLEDVNLVLGSVLLVLGAIASYGWIKRTIFG